MSPHNRDVTPKTQYFISTKCVSKLNTHNPPPYVRTYVSMYMHLCAYIQGTLPTYILLYYSMPPPSHPPSSHPPPSPSLLTHTSHLPSSHTPHTHNPHPPSSHSPPSPSLLTPTCLTLPPHTHTSHLPSSHIQYTPPSSPALLVQKVQETCWLLSDQLKTDRVVSEGDGIPHNALTHVLLLQTHKQTHIRTVVQCVCVCMCV